MLTVEQKNANELKYMSLLTKLNIDLTSLNKFLDDIDYFNKPASTQYMGAYPGGLCEHALFVAHELGVLCNAYYPGKYTEEDVIKVALFKDLYKATMYEAYMKNVKDETSGQWQVVPAFRTREGSQREVYGNAGLSSYMQAKKFVDLTDEQIEAIIYSSPQNFDPDIHDVMRSYPLVTLVRMAEMAVTYLT